MIQTKQTKILKIYIRILIIILALNLSTSLLYYQLLLPNHKTLFLTPIIGKLSTTCNLLLAIQIFCPILYWAIKHNLKYGFRYAFLHFNTLRAVQKALLQSGYYIKEYFAKSEIAVLPKIKLKLDSDLSKGNMEIENHPKYNKLYESLNLSSSLGVFLVDQHYLSDDENTYIFELSNSQLDRQEQFDTFKEFINFSNQADTYELLLDKHAKLPVHHLLIVGATGSGKTYLLYSLILQMMQKKVRYHLYFNDPKMSSFSILGNIVSPDLTAEEMPDIIENLKKFNDKMHQRKLETKNLLENKLDADYSTFGLEPYIFIIDEYSTFQSYVNTLEKKERDKINQQLSDIVRLGRQLGFFLWVCMLKSDSNTISTEVRENLIAKVVLGNAESTTYQTTFGTSANIPKRKYKKGCGLYTFLGLTTEPTRCFVPTMNFDILQALETGPRF